MKRDGRKLNSNRELWINEVIEIETVTCNVSYSRDVIKENKDG